MPACLGGCSDHDCMTAQDLIGAGLDMVSCLTSTLTLLWGT